jgi:ribosomal protein S12 methylthiotransferase accessory factor
LDIPFEKPRLRSNYDVVNLRDSILFKNIYTTIKIEGSGITDFLNKVLPLLDGSRRLSSILQSLSEYKEEDISNALSLLAENNLLEEGHSEGDKAFSNATHYSKNTQVQFFKDLSPYSEDVIRSLHDSKISVIGLGGIGASIVSTLANEGIGMIKCLDDSIVHEEDTYLCPLYNKGDIGKRRQDSLLAALHQKFAGTIFEASKNDKISEQSIASFVSDSDLVISCVDKSYLSVNYWLNRISLRSNIPWCVVSLEGNDGVIGPIIIPNETACYMCYTMRAMANEKSYDEAMAYQRFLVERKKDESYRRSNMAVNVNIVGNLFALEVIKYITKITSPSLIGKILTFDLLSSNSEYHTVLRKPDCPHCGFKKKDNIDRHGYHNNRQSTYNSLVTNNRTNSSSTIHELESLIVSNKVGIIRSIHRLMKDGLEPTLPYVLGVVLSNFNFRNDDDNDSKNVGLCSGKGMTIEEAKASALGEAIERYCSSQYEDESLIIATYNELIAAGEKRILNPKELVLYSDEQYNSGYLKYSKYTDDSRIRWIRGCSLIDQQSCLVPAIGVYMDYAPMGQEDFLFAPTSNGLAAGFNYSSSALAALLEVIERDAFMITWLCKLNMPQVDLDSAYHRRTRDFVTMYRRRGLELHVNVLLLDTGIPTFLASAIDLSNQGPALCIGLSAHPDPEVGLFKSLLEIGQIRPHLKREMRKPGYNKRLQTLLNDFRNVKTIEDHELLYTDKSMVKALSFLHSGVDIMKLDELPRIENKVLYDPQMLLQLCIARIKEKAAKDIVATDLTTSDISQFGLSVVRVVIPGFQPIDFGHNERRLGGKRLFEVPRELGYSDRILNYSDMNPFPHPLG